MKLYKHQQELLDLNPSKHLLAWECGTGKTLAAIELAKKNNLVPLIICPKSIKEQWREQVKKHLYFGFFDTVITKEEFRKNWNKLPKHNCLITDEAHYFSGIKSQMYKSLKSYVKKHDPQYIYLLTATPYLSTPWNIYCLASILGYKWSYTTFKSTFFVDVNMGGRSIPVIRRNIEPLIAKLVNKLGNTVRMDECVDVPEQVFQTEYFELTKQQKDAIKQIQEEETNHIVKWTKIHQICGGTLKGDGYVGDRTFKSEKLDRLKDICREHKKVVIVCRYNAEVEMIHREILNDCNKNKIEKHVGTIIGITKNKYDLVKRANKDKNVILVINAACSEGYELPTFPLMVFYSYDFSLKNYLQMIGRIQRMNHIKKNVYLSLVVKGTIDEDVKKSIEHKKDFDVAIYDK